MLMYTQNENEIQEDLGVDRKSQKLRGNCIIRNVSTFALAISFHGDKIKDEMGGKCSTHGDAKYVINDVGWEQKGNLGDLVLAGRIILKSLLRN
jgi:hypothetical protein